MQALSHVLELAAAAIGAVGAAVICWGVGVGVVLLVRLEVQRAAGGHVEVPQNELRQRVGYYLLLGLEFLLAADIVETISAPSLEHLGFLGAIVVLRTVISWSLTWELARHEARRDTPPAPPAAQRE